jgi:hypothetical protein
MRNGLSKPGMDRIVLVLLVPNHWRFDRRQRGRKLGGRERVSGEAALVPKEWRLRCVLKGGAVDDFVGRPRRLNVAWQSVPSAPLTTLQ